MIINILINIFKRPIAYLKTKHILQPFSKGNRDDKLNKYFLYKLSRCESVKPFGQMFF